MMTQEDTTKKLVQALFYLSRDFFFEEIDRADNAENIINESTTVEYFVGGGVSRYAVLRKEFQQKLETLSLSEMVNILQASETRELSKKVSSIKGWVTFLGWIVLIPILIGIFAILLNL